MFRGNDTKVSRQIFQKGYEIFLHSLQYDKSKAWSCDLCPKELDINQKSNEVDYDEVEVHVSDGIDMGTIQNTIKGFVGNEIFQENKVKNIVVKGIEAKERTFLNQQYQRDILVHLTSSQMKSNDTRKAIKGIENCKSKVDT